MELKQLNQQLTGEYKKSSGYLRYNQGSLSPNLTSRVSKFKLVSLSPLSFRANYHKSQGIHEQLNEMAKQGKKLPGILENNTKKIDSSQKILKYCPARFQISSSPEKVNEKKLLLPAIDADLQLLKDINSRSDHEAFLEHLMLRNSKYSCREEITHVNKEKRVRFQII